MTLFDSYSYDGVIAGIWVIHTDPTSGCKLVTFIDSNSYVGVSAGICVIHTGPKSGCKLVKLLSNRWLLLPFVSYGGHTYRSQIWVRVGDAFVLLVV